MMSDDSRVDHPTKSAGERRVRAILARSRQEVAVRDLLSFAVARVWTVLLSLAATAYALFSQWRNDPPNNTADSGEHPDAPVR